MKKNVLCALWGGMFILCAGLGFIPDPQGALKGLLMAVSVCFFVPPALLLYKAQKEADENTLKLVRNLSLLSLGFSLAGILLNILCATGSEALGNVLYSILIIISSPMICCGNWALSLFFWACLLMESLTLLKKEKK